MSRVTQTRPTKKTSGLKSERHLRVARTDYKRALDCSQLANEVTQTLALHFNSTFKSASPLSPIVYFNGEFAALP